MFLDLLILLIYVSYNLWKPALMTKLSKWVNNTHLIYDVLRSYPENFRQKKYMLDSKAPPHCPQNPRITDSLKQKKKER